ncbi:MAG: hypothetical protein K2Q07_05165 [Burkholderiaceae bacterium]|nr:hypothetical protein [Burkholderiaceae bacterium]
MSMHAVFAIIAATLALSGCSTPVSNDTSHLFKSGWRKGKVLETGTGHSLRRAKLRDCRDDGNVRPPETRYAYVEYRRTHLRQWQVVPMAAGQMVQPGDVVYVKVDGCDAPITLDAP